VIGGDDLEMFEDIDAAEAIFVELRVCTEVDPERC
jgi:hypothetical protein